jgi:hypothetical protein
MEMKTKAIVFYECEYDRVQAKDITCNEAFFASLNLTSLLHR